MKYFTRSFTYFNTRVT